MCVNLQNEPSAKFKFKNDMNYFGVANLETDCSINMNPKLLLCLALVSDNCFLSGVGKDAVAATNLPDLKIVSPQESVYLPGLGSATFSKQSSRFSLQVPVGFRKDGEKFSASTTNAVNVEAWLLKTDGAGVPQSAKPSMMTFGTIADYSTDYLFYEFLKVPASELAGVVVRSNGKFYSHQIETSDNESSIVPPDGNLFQISPTNIFQSPLSVHVADVDHYEHFTVFYKTDKAISDKFLYAWQELSDGGSVISSEPVTHVWTTNGAMFEFGGGNIWPFKIKIIEKQHRGETAMSGYSGYRFYLRDFATNTLMETKAVQVVNVKDCQEIVIMMPDLNESICFTKQAEQYTVQLVIKEYPGNAYWPIPKLDELHRQVWVLLADGTTIPQLQPPDTIGVGNAGWTSDRLIFKFPRKQGEDAVGVVVSLDGRLYCHEIKMTD